eukprot:scaffold1761_cov357-Prasinococcus_capsulatus_cf.AAC.15
MLNIFVHRGFRQPPLPAGPLLTCNHDRADMRGRLALPCPSSRRLGRRVAPGGGGGGAPLEAPGPRPAHAPATSSLPIKLLVAGTLGGCRKVDVT